MKNILTEALVNSATNASFIFSYTNSAKLRKEHVKVYPDTKELSELLQEMSQKLHESGFISDTKGFYEDVLLREKNYPTNLGSQMMVPHALFTFADKTGIEVALLKKPLEHDGNQVQLVFLLALEKKRNDEMNLLFQFFNQIVSHKKYMHELLQSEDSDAFIKNLYSFKLLYKKNNKIKHNICINLLSYEKKVR